MNDLDIAQAATKVLQDLIDSKSHAQSLLIVSCALNVAIHREQSRVIYEIEKFSKEELVEILYKRLFFEGNPAKRTIA